MTVIVPVGVPHSYAMVSGLIRVATFYESISANMEALDQGCNLACVERPAARQNLGNHALATHLGQVGLGQCVLVHQKAQHISGG